MKNTISYISSSFGWGIISKILDSGIKFVTIPLLLNYFGEEDIGLLTLAIATNAYMNLLNMGMNTGAVKFFSQWIATGNYKLINKVSRTNLTFYLTIGLINCFILILLAFFGEVIFSITPEQFYTFRNILFVLAGFSIVNWTTFVFKQLLVADEKMAFTQRVFSVRALFDLGVVLLTIHFQWSLLQYFILHLGVSSAIIIPFYIVIKKRKLIDSLVPAFYWKEFSKVLKYSLAIFAMSFFQLTATKSRPLILGMFTQEGVSVLTDYRIIEVFPIFIVSIGGMLLSILLPKSSKLVQQNNKTGIERLAYEGTKYSSIMVSLLSFPIILNSKEILSLYVGNEYSHLFIWLSIWIFTLTLYLHNSPVSSLVLSTGKTKMLVYSSAISCIVSIILNALLVKYFEVGSAVIGYLIYIIIHMSFYYLYFNSKVLGLNSVRVFKSFIYPTLCGIVSTYISYELNIQLSNVYILIFTNTIIWAITFMILLVLTRVVTLKEIKELVKEISIR